MDQLLHAFGIDGRLLIAQAVNFGVLLVVLWLVLYKPVMKTLDERKAKIAQCVIDADEAAKKLAGADEEASKIVHSADQEASALVSSARETANAEKARLLKEAEERAAKIAQDADARAKEAANKMLKESEREIARLAILAAEKTIRSKS